MDATQVRADDVWIAVVGMTGAGKSTFISCCTGEPPLNVGHGLESFTKKTAVHTLDHRGKRIHLVDTPGFGDTHRSDEEVFSELAYTLTKSYTMGVRVSGILYMHPISDFRMQGSGMRILRLVKALCGEEAYASIVLIATHCGNISTQTRKDRMFELRTKPHFWGDLCRLGSQTAEFEDNKESALGILDLVISLGRSFVLKFQQQMVDERMRLQESDAGKEVFQSLVTGLGNLTRELAELNEEFESALNAGQERNAQEIEQAMSGLEHSLETERQVVDELNTTAESLIGSWDKRLEIEDQQLSQRLEVLDTSISELKDGKKDASSHSTDSETKKKLNEAEKERADLLAAKEARLSKHAVATGWISAIAGVVGVGVAVAALACTIM